MARRGGAGPRPTRLGTTLVAIAALFVTISGCGALAGSGAQDAPAEGGGNGQLEKSQIRLGVLPIVDVASVYLAESEGYFANEGLNVELVTVQGGAAAIPSLVNGELDVTFGNWVSFFLAQSQGIADFRIISDGYQAEEKMFPIVATPQTGLQTAADLAGKRVAVNTFRNIAELLTRSAVQQAGVDPNSVQFVEMPFPDMLPAMQNNQVDAAFVSEPFITIAARDLGAVTVADTATGPTEQIPIAGYSVTDEFAQQNPKTVAAFQRAMARGQEAANDRSNVERIVPTYSSITPEVASLLNLGTWPTTLNATRLQRVADLMLEFGVLKEKLDVAPMVLEPAP